MSSAITPPTVTPAALAPTVPVEAPYAGEQRAYVEGFLAALQSVRQAHAAAAAAESAGPGEPLTILYGSQSGNAESLAKQLRKAGRGRGFDPTVKSLDAFGLDNLPDVPGGRVLVICSTFGEGDPPDNAKRFLEQIESEAAPDLSGVSYSVCALGDRSYTHFCRSGAVLDERFAELGATRLVERVDCDVDFDEPFAAWKDAVFASEPMAAITEAAGAVVTEDEDPVGQGGWGKSNPYFAPVTRVENLNGEGSAKEVNHIEILLSGSGLEYEVGDALGLCPVNDPILVENILALCGVTGTDRVLIKGETFPIRLALQTKLDVVTLTQGTLDALGIEGSIEEVKGLHLIDAIRKWAPSIGAQGLADALRGLQPRLYSIASSPKAHPGEVHLTVGAVRYALADRKRKGVASTFLADRCGFGTRVGVYVHKAPHFHLTEDDQAPIIMVGPGTGIAPFRAFLEERHARKSPGQSWLFFGDQHEKTDYLYREQLAELQEAGTLTRLSLAWSRDGKEKVYVQDKMRGSGEELFNWLERGGHFYVCGDAARMAGDVDAALREIIGEYGKRDESGVQQYIDQMIDQNRYQRDVY